MDGLGWIAAIIIGGLAGWIGGRMMNADFGILTNIVLGIVGALVMNWILFMLVGGTLGGWLGQMVVGAIGAMLLIAVWRAIRRS